MPDLRMFRSLSFYLVIAGAVLMARTSSATHAADTVRYTATAVNLDPSVAVTATLVDFNITRWSTDDERKQMLALVAENNQDRLLQALKALPRVGTMKTPDTLSYDLHYARRTQTDDGGEQVVLVTDRDIAIWEIANMTRSREYAFTVVELRLDARGEGEGKITVATKIASDRSGQIVLENYGNQPVRLTSVKRDAK
jgi:hypothetical protein